MSTENKTLKSRRPDIFTQVDPELTLQHYPKINLDSITYGSKKKVWWRCDADSRHVWDAAINDRVVGGNGCLICAGYRAMAGINDLEFLNPTVASQWHPTKNGTLLPSEVTATTNKKMWWKCPIDSRHEWQASIKLRHYGSGCPICDNKIIMAGINDFATASPELLPEWNNELNGSLTPHNTSPSSAKKIWWNCPKDQRHVYIMSLNDRHNNHGCTVCAGRVVIQHVNDAATYYPHLLSEWHPTKNGELTLSDISSMSEKRVWWICKVNPVHEWDAIVNTRTNQNQGCPICSGARIMPGINDLETHNPHLAKQWHPTLNKGIQPNLVAPYSNTKYWWKCSKDQSHVWEASPNNRNNKSNRSGSDCPKCIIYKTERAFRELFNNMTDLEFTDGKVPVKWRKRNLTQIDILNKEKKICIEYDGLWSHGGKSHSPFSQQESIERDKQKTNALLTSGYIVIRIREAGLPFLPIMADSFFQIHFELNENKNLVAEKCIEFLNPLLCKQPTV